MDDDIIPKRRRRLKAKEDPPTADASHLGQRSGRPKTPTQQPAEPPENLIPASAAFVAPDVTPLVPASPSDIPGMVTDTFTTAEAEEFVPPPPAGDKTFAELWAAWKETWTVAKSTADTREYRCKMLAKVLDLHTPIKQLTLPRLRKLQADLLATDLSPTTVNDVMFKIVRQALEHAVEEGWLRANPAERVKPLKKAETIREQHSWADCWRIIEEVERTSPESGEILRFMLSFGCGQAEVKDLRGEHITTDHVMFKRRKTQRVYRVPVFEHAKAQVRDLLDSGRCQRGKPTFQWRDPEQAFRGASTRLGLPLFELRSLRRAFILFCLENGVEYRVVASWVGHRDARLVLNTYGAHISKAHEQAQLKKLRLQNIDEPV